MHYRSEKIGSYVGVSVIAWLIIAFCACKKMDAGAPHIDAISPISGLSGNLVTIKGSGFATDPSKNTVRFNGVEAQVVKGSQTELYVIVPAQATTGPVSVAVNGKEGKGPVYSVSNISVTNIGPLTGPRGTKVTVDGSGLVNTGDLGSLADLPTVTFNGKAGKLVSYIASKIVVEVPDSAGFGPIVVSLNGQKIKGPDFYFLGINTVGPLSGNAGTRVVLKGGFGDKPELDTVTFNGLRAQVISASPDQLVVKVPANDTTGLILVRMQGQTFRGPFFTFVLPPAVEKISPNSGPAGTKVTVSGYYFSTVAAEDSVWINGVLAKVLSASGNQLMIEAPAATSGPLTIRINGQSGAGPSYNYQKLGIAAVTPVNAFPPDTVTVSGVGFSKDPAKNDLRFNGVPVTVLSASETELVVSVPANVQTGPITVTVDGLTATGPVFSTAGVYTLAGGTYGAGDGVGRDAGFAQPMSVAVDAAGNVFVGELGAKIRKVTPEGAVTTFAGSTTGENGHTDGQGTDARFGGVNSVAFDKQGNLFAEDLDHGIRKIAPDATVTTFVLNPDGINFNNIAVDAAGNVYGVAGAMVYEFSSAGTLKQTVTIPGAITLYGVAVDAQGNVYTSDNAQGYVYRNSQVVASGFKASYLALDKDGNLLMTSLTEGGWIYRMNTTTLGVEVLAGGHLNSGATDGLLKDALFNWPSGIAMDQNTGIIYLAEQNYGVIRKITP